MLWSLHCFILLSFVYYMNCHLYCIWIAIHYSYTEAIMFLIFGRLPLKMDFMYFLHFMRVEIMCEHRATWENSQWLNCLPCINILEIKKIDDVIMNQSHYLNRHWNIVNWTLSNKLWWNFNRNHAFSFKKMHLKRSAKWWPFCLGLNVLRTTAICLSLCVLKFRLILPPFHWNCPEKHACWHFIHSLFQNNPIN